MAAMAAFSSASAAATAAARCSGDNVEAEGDELSFRLTVSTSIGIRPRRDAFETGKPPRCLLDFLPIATTSANVQRRSNITERVALGQTEARAALERLADPNK